MGGAANMNRILKSVLKVVSYINIAFLVSLMGVTVIDVIARYAFNTSILDAIALSSFLLAMLNAMALAGITYRKGHVQVEIIYRHLPSALKTVFDSINSLLAGAVFFVMAWFSFIKAAEGYHRGLYQGWMHLPEYPIKYVFAFGCLMTAVTFFILFINRIFEKDGGNEPPDRA